KPRGRRQIRESAIRAGGRPGNSTGAGHAPRAGGRTADMAPASGKNLLPFIRDLAGPGDTGSATDAQLLEWFLGQRHEVAFRAMVDRHGPMVLAVCRRVLGDAHDTEDAFQATFLVLARKADALRPRALVANWLYGVAYRTA